MALATRGYDVVLATDGREARARFSALPPDVVILDLGLPDVDGVDLCREFRTAAPNVAIIVLTARQEEVDVVVGLDAGADDYVTKPFRLAELLARIRAQLRSPAPETADSKMVAGDIVIDLDARRVWVDDVEVALRPREFDLFALLASEAGVVITRDRLMQEIWDSNWYGSTKTLDVHISTLRRKLGMPAGPQRPVITALPRVGYRLDLP